MIVYITYLDFTKAFYHCIITSEYDVDFADAQCSLQINHNPWVHVGVVRGVCIAVGIYQFPIRKLLR